jgi:predicted secreted protein
MAQFAARTMLIKKNAVTIANIREKSLKINAEPIDVTTDDDGIWRKLLSAAEAEKSIELSFSGLAEEDDLKTIGFDTVVGNCMVTDITITDPSAGSSLDIISCNWFLTSYEITGSYKDALMFNATMVSSGVPSRA